MSDVTSLLALASTLGQFGGGGPRLAPFARPPPAHPSVSHQALPVYLSPVLVLVLSATLWIRLPSFPLLCSLHSFLVLFWPHALLYSLHAAGTDFPEIDLIKSLPDLKPSATYHHGQGVQGLHRLALTSLTNPFSCHLFPSPSYHLLGTYL